MYGKKILVLVIGGLLASPSFAAERGSTNKEESIGLGSGAAIGAIAGGPVGLILGAAFGGWLGDRFHHERDARVAAEVQAGEVAAQADSLQTRLAANERELARRSSALETERVAHRRNVQEALSVEVFFRTEESAVSNDTGERLAKLATLVAPMPDTVISLEGHADARGTEDFNAELATARAEAVRDALVSGGMPAERIVLTAAGESLSTAPPEDAEGMALERRVTLSVVTSGGEARVAQRSID